jgi:hypothetical protein
VYSCSPQAGLSWKCKVYDDDTNVQYISGSYASCGNPNERCGAANRKGWEIKDTMYHHCTVQASGKNKHSANTSTAASWQEMPQAKQGQR